MQRFIRLLIATTLVIISNCNTSYASNHCVGVDDDKSIDYGLKPHAIIAARSMINNTLNDWRNLCQYDKIEITKRLNYLVYNYCTDPKSNANLENINDLFGNCQTTCGGRSYVLRGLLAVYGIHTRHMSIYNIPIQGNHTAVEVEDKNRYMFFDPTFGTYFSKSLTDAPLDLQSMQYYLDDTTIKNFVFQAKKTNELTDTFKLPLATLYKNNFKSSGLALRSYINAEAIGSEDAENLLLLTANLKLINDTYELGCTAAKTREAATDCILSATNKLYAGRDLSSYISYDISYLGYFKKQMKLNAFNFSNLKNNRYYKALLLIDNPNKMSVDLVMGTSGNEIILSPTSTALRIAPGLSRYEISFKAKDNRGTLLLYPVPGKKWSANLLALKIGVAT